MLTKLPDIYDGKPKNESFIFRIKSYNTWQKLENQPNVTDNENNFSSNSQLIYFEKTKKSTPQIYLETKIV